MPVVAQQIAHYVNPVLTALKRLGGSAQPAEVYSTVIQDLRLEGSPLLEETLKSGGSKFEDIINWVRFNLAFSGYIDRSKRGVWTLTEKGRHAPTMSIAEVNALLLDIHRQRKRASEVTLTQQEDTGTDETDAAAPEETNYKAQLLTTLQSLPPKGFEQICQRLLRESGFEQVVVTGNPSDGGIDGIGVLKVNPFVAFKVLFQCKRYAGSVSPSQVRDFRGAMQGRADKGIILTTGTFTSEAQREAVRDGVPPIELIDGEHLVALFETLELGLVPRTTYDLELSFFRPFQSPE